MAKEVKDKDKDKKEEYTQEQYTAMSMLDDDGVITFKEALKKLDKLNKIGRRFNADDVKYFMDFFDNASLTPAKAFLFTSLKQKERFIDSVCKTNNPEYALKTAKRIEITIPEKLEKIIEKDEDASFEYAVSLMDMTVSSKTLKTPLELILNHSEFADIMDGKPSEETIEKVAELLSRARFEDLQDMHLNMMTNAIFGKTEEQRKKAQEKLGIKEDKDGKLSDSDTDKVSEEVEKINNIISDFKSKVITKLEQIKKDAKATAVNDLAEENKKEEVNEFKRELENNKPLKKALEDNVSRKFNEFFKKELDAAQIVMNDIKKRHPRDYENYLNKLRKTSTYKREYQRYSQMFSQKRAEIREQEVAGLKKSIDASSKKQAVSTNTSTSQKVETEEATM